MMYGPYECREKDWKLFRKRLPVWQEAHMERLIQDYIKLLGGEGKASERFWALEKRIRQDQRAVGVSAEMRRSRLLQNLMSLLDEGAITVKDLEGFSEDLKTRLYGYAGIPYEGPAE